MTIDMAARPIKNEADYDRALAEIEPLLQAELGSPEENHLVVLSKLIEAYEKEHYPIGPPTPLGALEHYMDRMGLEPSALEPYLGSPLEVAAVLNRERPLTLDMIRRLHDGLASQRTFSFRRTRCSKRPDTFGKKRKHNGCGW